MLAAPGGAPLRANLPLNHLLTGFGHTVDANVYLQRGPANLFVTVHGYANHDRAFFPGVDAELVDYRHAVFGRALEWSCQSGGSWKVPSAK